MGDPPPGTANRFGVGLEGVDIVQVRLPVLDKPSVIRRYHPHSIMTPLHTTHRSVVSLGQHDIIMIINSQKRILFGRNWGNLSSCFGVISQLEQLLHQTGPSVYKATP